MGDAAMDVGRYARAKPIFLAALQLTADERARFVEENVRDDSALAEEIHELLANADRGERMFERVLQNAVRQSLAVPDRRPERIGRHIVLDEIGRGGMGVVYRALHVDFGREVAIKLLLADLPDDRARERFAREARLLARLDDPAIAHLYETGQLVEAGRVRPWFAMELVAGVPPDEYVEREKPDLRGRVELVARIARAVAVAHAQHVVHRDLKQSNLSVRDDGSVVVLDFGIARGALEDGTRLTQAGRLLGSFCYASPEQVLDPCGDVDARADVYALGVITFELLTGHRLHDERRGLPTLLLDRVRQTDTAPLRRHLSDVPREIEAMVATALAHDAARRYANAAEYALDLQRWLDGLPVRAREPGTWDRVRLVVSRHRALSAAIVASVVILGAGWGLTWNALRNQRISENALEQLALERSVASLEQRAPELYPAEPFQIENLESWLREADAIDVRSRAAGLRSDAGGSDLVPASRPPEVRAALDPGMRTELTRRLDRFFARGGIVEDVRARLDRALTLHARTVEAYREEWVACLARTASSEQYGGLAFEPQPGLVPLGRDRESGLEEYALFELTGTAPVRGPDGALRHETDTGIVLVLLPGGHTWMGSQSCFPEERHYYAHARLEDGPVNEVELDPFFVSKFEWTNAQFVAAFGADPGTTPLRPLEPTSPGAARLPVETMSWIRGRTYLHRLGLELPTEAQWEYAARGGRGTYWWSGGEPCDLAGTGNVTNFGERVDPSGVQVEGFDVPDCLDDQYPDRAPVGMFRANPYGLHDVYGNMPELCLDTFRTRQFDYRARPGDGLRIGPENRLVVLRGGGFAGSIVSANSSYRNDVVRTRSAGVRPARPLRGPWTRKAN